MKLLERLRNHVEASPAVSSAYAIIGRTPPYRRFIYHHIARRLEYVRVNRAYGVIIETTSACNARCSFCPNRTMRRSRQLMPPEVFDTILRRMQEEGLRPPFIDLFQVGEPLVDKHIFERTRRVKDAFPRSVVRFTSNMALADDDVLRSLLTSGLDSLHISLNAVSPETYNQIMHLDYERTVANVERLLVLRSELNPRLNVRVSMVICPDNEREAGEFVHRWQNKVDNVFLQRATDWGGSIRMGSRYPVHQALYPCIDLFERIVIQADGGYAICCIDYEGRVGANVLDRGLLEAFGSEPFALMREGHMRGDLPAMCHNCFGVRSNGAIWALQSLFASRYTL
jgi:pyruvate-formate lyase-activating enzyme